MAYKIPILQRSLTTYTHILYILGIRSKFLKSEVTLEQFTFLKRIMEYSTNKQYLILIEYTNL